MHMRHAVFFVLAIIAALIPAKAEHLVVSAASLRQAIANAPAGAEIYIAEGRYDLTDVKLPREVVLIGRGEVTFFSSKPVEKGILNPLPGAALRVENIRFEGAVSPDLNGAGIRHDGKDLIVYNCVFDGNENGILSTGSERGKILIAGSSFLNNGHGDGYSHGIYVVQAALLEISESRFTGTKIGHHVKSLAAITRITGSHFDDADGGASYTLDVSGGGDVTMADNVIIQTASSDNPAIINYDLSRGGDAVALRITGNHIINRHRHGVLLRNDTKLEPEIHDNEIVNEAGGRLALPKTMDAPHPLKP